MFAAAYFAPRYFAPRYWPEVGSGSGVQTYTFAMTFGFTAAAPFGLTRLTWTKGSAAADGWSQGAAPADGWTRGNAGNDGWTKQ